MRTLRVSARMRAPASRWRHGLIRMFGQVEVTTAPAFDEGRIDQYELSGARLVDIRAGAQHLVRPPAEDDLGRFLSLILQLEGRAWVEQAGREVELEPGAMTLIDAKPASGFSFPARYRQMLLLVPREALRTMPALVPATRMDAGEPVDRLLLEQLRHLPEPVPALEPLQQVAVLTSVLALLRASTAFRRPDRSERLFLPVGCPC